MPSYLYIAFDHATQLFLFTHHVDCRIVGAAAHTNILMGFSFGLYIHNDTMNALGRTGDIAQHFLLTYIYLLNGFNTFI